MTNRLAQDNNPGDADLLEGAMASGSGDVPVLEQALRSVDIFRDLTIEQRAQVAAIGRMAAWRQGERLGLQGQIGDALWVLLSGQVELTTASPFGHLRVRIAGPGESLPLAAFIGDGKLITTAQILSDMEAVEIPARCS